jgi:hypothetical protein
MKIVLEYNIPEDLHSAWCAYNAHHLHHAITEIEQRVREVRKYSADPTKSLKAIEDSIKELYAIAGHPLNG